MTGKRYLGVLFALVALPLAACGSDVETGGTGGSASGTGGAGGQGGTGGAGGQGGDSSTITLTCHADTVKYPTVSRACESDPDCAIAVYTVDCCGSLAAVGIDTHDYPLIEDAETQCKNAALCDCAPKQTVDEKGQSGDYVALSPLCEMGICRAYFK
ncbi:hypothetical protein [Polyangium aurulentum]|uniref:hypothetical protein n=1 Tax=Polyangium aurulentum TaxID=2567896 RepID=UPI00197D3534|nr:hypothetical protein [Polyangium aurulentum]UQA57764.1 hypothetical protein E8A73_041875 [Polyangium aurulentum]